MISLNFRNFYGVIRKKNSGALPLLYVSRLFAILSYAGEGGGLLLPEKSEFSVWNVVPSNYHSLPISCFDFEQFSNL